MLNEVIVSVTVSIACTSIPYPKPLETLTPSTPPVSVDSNTSPPTKAGVPKIEAEAPAENHLPSKSYTESNFVTDVELETPIEHNPIIPPSSLKLAFVF